MHPRLRRQLDRHLGAGEKPTGRIRKLLGEIDLEYARADRDGASLRRVLELVSDLLQRKDELATVERPARPAGPLTRALRRLFAQAPFAMVCCDKSLRVTAWNPAAQRLLGWAGDETEGRDVTTFLAAEADRAALRAYLAASEPVPSIRAATARDGRSISCQWHVSALRSRAGAPSGFAILLEEAAPDRFAAAVDGSGDAAFEWDMRANRLWVSDRFRALIGGEDPGATPA